MSLRVKVNKRDVFRTFRHMDQMRLAIAFDAGITAEMQAREYVDLVRSGIGGVDVTPSFVPVKWASLSPNWTKIKTANKNKFWLETGGILNNIRVNILARTLNFIRIFGGIDVQDDRDAFFRALRNEFGEEMGSKSQSPRPLFGPAISQFANRRAGGGGILRREKFVPFLLVVSRAINKVYVFSGRGVN